jgi:hypothetical protein
MTQETAAGKEKSQVTKQRMKILNSCKIASVLMPYMVYMVVIIIIIIIIADEHFL